MSVEKYVNTITKRIKCSKEKRMDIKRQLLSDISVSLEQGETLEQVMARMGSADMVSREFNQNLSVSEVKKYKQIRRIKIILIVIVIIVVLMGIGYWILPKNAEIGSSGVFEKSKVEQQTKQVIQELNENDFETLKGEATDEMQDTLNLQTIENARKSVSEDWGEFQTFGNIYMGEIKQHGQLYAVVQVNTVYEEIGVTYTITFDDEMKLAGLYMK